MSDTVTEKPRVRFTDLILLDEFAGQALSGLVSANPEEDRERIARRAYAIAAAMLDERQNYRKNV